MVRDFGGAQVPILAKADSMTVEELQAFRRDVRDALAQVRAHAGSIRR